MPSPGKHYPKFPKEAPSWGLGKPHVKGVDKAEATARLGPGAYNAVIVSHCSRSAPFSMTAKSGKGPAVHNGTELSDKIRNVQKKKRDQV